VRLRPRLGRRRASGGPPLLPEAAGRRAVHARDGRALPGRAGRFARALAAPARNGAARGVRGARSLRRARELLPRGRARRAGGGGLARTPRAPVPLAAPRLEDLRRLPRLAAPQ